ALDQGAAGVATDAEAMEGLVRADAEVAVARRREPPVLERGGAARRHLLRRRQVRLRKRRRGERHHLPRALDLERIGEGAVLDDPELVPRLAGVGDLVEGRPFRRGARGDVEAKPALAIADL